MGADRYRYCPSCGAEYQAWLERCTDCDVALGAPGEVRELGATFSDAPRRTVHMDLGHLSEIQRERLALLLRGAEVRFEVDEDGVWVPESRRRDLDQLVAEVGGVAQLDELDELDVDGDAGPGSAAVVPAGPWVRATAKVIDSVLVSVVLAAAHVGVGPLPIYSWVVPIIVLVAVEGVYGTTPGKAVLGLGVRFESGADLTVRAAFVRNAWQLAGLVPYVGAPLIAVVQILIGRGIHRDPWHRGPHDRWAGTVVGRRRHARATSPVAG